MCRILFWFWSLEAWVRLMLHKWKVLICYEYLCFTNLFYKIVFMWNVPYLIAWKSEAVFFIIDDELFNWKTVRYYFIAVLYLGGLSECWSVLFFKDFQVIFINISFKMTGYLIFFRNEKNWQEDICFLEGLLPCFLEILLTDFILCVSIQRCMIQKLMNLD